MNTFSLQLFYIKKNNSIIGKSTIKRVFFMKIFLLATALLLVSNLNAKDVVYDTTTSLLWQDASINKKAVVTFTEATNYCKYLEIEEYKDFRLPTLTELQTLINYKKYKPAILDGFNYVESTTYWTTTPFADSEDEYWIIDFEKGARNAKSMYYDRHFRCVQKLK